MEGLLLSFKLAPMAGNGWGQLPERRDPPIFSRPKSSLGLYFTRLDKYTRNRLYSEQARYNGGYESY